METRNITVPETAEYIEGLYHQPNAALMAFRKESDEAMVPILLKETEALLQQLIQLDKFGCDLNGFDVHNYLFKTDDFIVENG